MLYENKWNPAVKTADAALHVLFMCKKPLCFWCCQPLLLHGWLQSGNQCCSDLLCVGVATVPQTLKTIPPQCSVLLMLDDKLILTESWFHFKIFFVCPPTISCSFPTAVHETSKRLSQTLRDIYESDWYGGEDLAVITEVRSWCVFINVCSDSNPRAGSTKPGHLDLFHFGRSGLFSGNLVSPSRLKEAWSYHKNICVQTGIYAQYKLKQCRPVTWYLVAELHNKQILIYRSSSTINIHLGSCFWPPGK